jgi:signal transduction histidine kinase
LRLEFLRVPISLSHHDSEDVLVRYGITVAATIAVLAFTYFLHGFVGTPLPYILLFALVAFSSWSCGVGPSAVALALALVGLRYWFITPLRSLRVPDSTQSICLLAFLLASAGVIAMGEARRRQNEKLRRAQAKLEDRVRERTADLDAANSSLRDLSARLLKSQDEERRRLARELHDSIGQLLAALGMNLTNVRGDIERLKKMESSLLDSEAIVQEMSKEVRTISHLLHPPLLDEAGLDSAIRWYAEGFAQRSQINVNLDSPKELGRFPRDIETAVFRVVQECLTNIHRHSGSPSATIRLRRRDGEVFVEIADQGKGMPQEKQETIARNGTPGVGIRGMRERIRQLGGTLEVSSNGSGTIITAQLPVSEASSMQDDSEVPDTSSTAAA